MTGFRPRLKQFQKSKCDCVISCLARNDVKGGRIREETKLFSFAVWYCHWPKPTPKGWTSAVLPLCIAAMHHSETVCPASPNDFHNDQSLDHLFILFAIFLLECRLSNACLLFISLSRSILMLEKGAIRSKSRWPLCVIRLPPFSSSCSSTPSFSSACMTLRSTEPDASTWWFGREPRFLVLPWTFFKRPTPTVLRR